MGLLDTMLRKILQVNSTSLLERSKWNFVSGLTAVDNPDTNATDIVVAGGMTADDKTKLDGLQKQGAAVAVSAYAIDWSLGGMFTKTLGAGAQVFTFDNEASGMVIVVRVTGAASTLTWPTVSWAGGTPPTQTASGIDIYTFVHDGTNIYGSVVQDLS